MDEDKRGWRQFRSIKLDRKQFSKRVRKAETVTQRHAHRFVVKRLDNARLVTREITIWLLLIGGMIAALGVQLLWGQVSYMKIARDDGGRFVEGVVGTVETLNPLYVSTNSEASVSRLVFSSLYNYDKTSSLHQDLATGMTIDETDKVYTVTIRKDAQWHDKTPLTADDIVYTINTIKNPTVRSPLRVNWTDVGVKAIDKYTVQFTLPAVYAAFPYALTFPVLPQHILKDIAPGAIRESTFSRSPVGSGPFEFRRLQPADQLTNHKTVHLAVNDHYYGGRAKLDAFEIHAYETQDDVLKALRRGELAGAAGISVTARDKIDKKSYNVNSEPDDSGVYLLLNTSNPVLKDVKVRQALQAVTDTAAIRKQLSGDVQPLELPILPSQLGTVADIPTIGPANITKAQTLLDEAGWKMNGSYRVKDGNRLELTVTTTKNSEYEPTVKLVAEQWQRLGIKVNQRVVDASQVSSNFVQDVLQRRNFDVLLYELMIGADPDVYAYWHSSQIGQTGYNFSNYNNKTADALLSSARSRLEPELRDAKYRQFAKQWLQDAPAIALYQPVTLYAADKNVHAVSDSSAYVTLADRYANVQYWTVSNRLVYKTP